MAAKIRIKGHVPRNELIETQKKTKDARLYRNIEIVLFAYDGLSATKIANRINCSPATVCGWIRSWNEQGLDGLT
ncbi:MAG: helix-turn-helix domain-containing protein, partial [Methanosarcinales archaeon]|nr:helix-turn-helix domain-containing protein [Candidatus Ethanoperedens thermophilum]